MSDATTPADPTDQIAATPAVLSPGPPIVPASGTKRVPDDSEAAYDWRLDLHLLDRRARDKYEEGDGYETDRLAAYIVDVESERDSAYRLYSEARAHIERLEAEYPCRGVMDCARCEHHIPPYECEVLVINARHKAERDALLAEHEAAKRLEHWHPEGCRFCAAHDNAERVIHGE